MENKRWNTVFDIYDKGTYFSRIMHSFYPCHSVLPSLTNFIMGLTCLWGTVGFRCILEVTVFTQHSYISLKKTRESSINLFHKFNLVSLGKYIKHKMECAKLIQLAVLSEMYFYSCIHTFAKLWDVKINLFFWTQVMKRS